MICVNTQLEHECNSDSTCTFLFVFLSPPLARVGRSGGSLTYGQGTDSPGARRRPSALATPGASALEPLSSAPGPRGPLTMGFEYLGLATYSKFRITGLEVGRYVVSERVLQATAVSFFFLQLRFGSQ